MKKIILLAFVVLSLFACKKTTATVESYGVVRDFTGLDGCGLLIVLDDGHKLEIKSLPSGITLTNNKRVAVIYKPASGFSICMAGEIVDVTSLRYLWGQYVNYYFSYRIFLR